MPLIQKNNFGTSDIIRASFHTERYRKAIHMHQFLEIVYVMDGEMIVKTGGKQATAKSGDIIIIYPYQAHGFYTENNKNSKLWMLLFSGSIIMDIIKSYSGLNEYENVIFSPSKELKTFIESKLIDTNEKLTEIDEAQSRRLKALLYPIFDEYLAQNPVSVKQKKLNSSIINLILSYTQSNFYQNVTVSDCAKKIGYSKSYISHILSQTMHKTFTEVRDLYRIDYAKTLLLQTDMSTFRVGLECGFNCERSFERAFKKLLKVTPKQYREKHS